MNQTIIKILIIIVILIIFTILFISANPKSKPKLNGGVLTLYQNKNELQEYIDLYTDIRLNKHINKPNTDPDVQYYYYYVDRFITYVKNKINDFHLIIAHSIYFDISLIEIYILITAFNNKINNRGTKISLCIKNCIGVGSFNIALLTKNDFVIRIDRGHLFHKYTLNHNYKYNKLKILKKIYESDASFNLPEILFSSMDIIPDTLDQHTNFVPMWFVELKYQPIIKNDINIIKYMDLIINISKNIRTYNMMYTDWKLNNIMYDNINNRYVLIDFDFMDINDVIINKDLNNVVEFKNYSANIVSSYITKNNDPSLWYFIRNTIKEVYTDKDMIDIETNRIFALFIALYDIINIYISNTYNVVYNVQSMQLGYFHVKDNMIQCYIERFKQKLNETGLMNINIFNSIINKIMNDPICARSFDLLPILNDKNKFYNSVEEELNKLMF